MKTHIKLATILGVIGLGFGTIVSATPAYAADYDMYDTNNDNAWNETEWYDYSYDAIDYDDSGYIDDNEWTDYTTVWYEPYETSYDYDYEYYDANDDGLIDEDEYAEVDSDLFNEWDDNNDGVVANNEYDTALDSYDDAGEGGVFDW